MQGKTSNVGNTRSYSQFVAEFEDGEEDQSEGDDSAESYDVERDDA